MACYHYNFLFTLEFAYNRPLGRIIYIELSFSVPQEVQLVKREYFNRWYGLKAYYAALVCSRTPATILFSLIFLIVVYPLTSQPLEIPRILMFTTICILVALISESMGTVISAYLNVVVSTYQV